MSTLKVFKETSLPSDLQADSVYFIAPEGSPGLVEIYVTTTDGTISARHVINKAEIQAMIDASVGAANELTIVADITARDALTPTRATYVYVTDATGDTTVASGGATYLYNPTSSAWIKTSEAESMDATVTWASITSKPTSSATAIDNAVAASHTHANKMTLDLLSHNVWNEVFFNGVSVKTAWSSTAW